MRIFQMVVCLVVLSYGIFISESFAREIFNNVSVSEAQYMMSEQNNNKVDLVLDVRTGGEYARSHIKDAVLIPIMILTEKMNEIEREQTILVYCHNGNRSKTACELFSSKGHKHVYNMIGGIESWIEKGFDVVE
ncbi:MAG: rhodanese-like domain-containing protein [Candidatus Scalindua sp.]|jgi:rhodanese-related sulfurtransferase|nr:rhodanese-like domain-containing protein [Candidatus Scalindua sp.]MBT5303485.1 rhodanese-like domain-containing protein [Candidatus Scalindua sp.]MBT6053006.1 rhodanese-like domain-containing protein [Candidatus Scalindua sp.]MBT6231034.1 rhodanese-like domain-containing protein [Candidatus Scalindua sp.]MBT6561629.1 rhodanese-like domain-containing protein [Candidatus Scalindua sp.]